MTRKNLLIPTQELYLMLQSPYKQAVSMIIPVWIYFQYNFEIYPLRFKVYFIENSNADKIF